MRVEVRSVFWTPGTGAPGTHRTTSASPAASTGQHALRSSTCRVPQIWYRAQNTRRRRKPVSAEAIARVADEEGMCHGSSPITRMMGRIQRVNVDLEQDRHPYTRQQHGRWRSAGGKPQDFTPMIARVTTGQYRRPVLVTSAECRVQVASRCLVLGSRAVYWWAGLGPGKTNPWHLHCFLSIQRALISES